MSMCYLTARPMNPCAISPPGFLKNRNATIVAVVFIFEVTATTVLAQSASPTPIESGDKTLLTTWSLATLVEPGAANGRPPVYAYEKAVENHTTNVIVDVYWILEDFYRRFLPPGKTSETATADGFLQYPPPKGPLYFGTGTDHFDSRAYTPNGGFNPSKTSSIERGSTSSERGNVERSLNSTIQVAVPSETGLAMCNLEITSAIIPSVERASNTTFQYRVHNRGSEPVWLFWDVPRDEKFGSELGISKDYPLAVEKGGTYTRVINWPGTATSALSTFVVFDKDRKVISTSVVETFGANEGKTTALPSEFWPQHHQ